MTLLVSSFTNGSPMTTQLDLAPSSGYQNLRLTLDDMKRNVCFIRAIRPHESRLSTDSIIESAHKRDESWILFG